MNRLLHLFSVAGFLALGPAANGLADSATEAALRQEVADLKARLEVLEQHVRALSASQSTGPAIMGPERPAPQPEPVASAEASPSGLDVGGALRFNLVYRDDVEASEGKYGESGLDIFRLNIDGALDNILVSAEYRFYSYMQTLHHGWLGYEFPDQSQVQVGVSQVPFGLQPYAAHNAWFGVPYYLGMADDYDMGVKYLRTDGPWSTQLAFYKNEELNSAADLDRYSFDLVREGNQQNEEVDQFNARVAYTFGLGSNCETELGVSLELGQVYNNTLDERGDRHSGAMHLDSRCGRWNLQLQGGSYRFDVVNPAGVDDSIVRLGAFSGAYDIASEGEFYVANVAYNLPSPWQAVDSLTCYNDYSILDKGLDGARDSQINTLGCAIGSGPLFTYVDYILARNMPYFGAGSLAGDGESDWQGRLNVNIGYYW